MVWVGWRWLWCYWLTYIYIYIGIVPWWLWFLYTFNILIDNTNWWSITTVWTLTLALLMRILADQILLLLQMIVLLNFHLMLMLMTILVTFSTGIAATACRRWYCLNCWRESTSFVLPYGWTTGVMIMVGMPTTTTIALASKWWSTSISTAAAVAGTASV